MKQEFVQSREVLIGHLEEKIAQLKQQRNEIVNKQTNVNQNTNQHVNIGQYLKGQNIQVEKTKIKPTKPTKVNNFVVSNQPPMKSKADIIREQKQTKERLLQLEDMYKKKRELESIGIVENNTNKIQGMYNNKDMRRKIERKVSENKKKDQMKKQKDKIIKEELQKVQSFLKESQQGNKKKSHIPVDHYSMVIQDKQKLKVYESFVKKGSLSLVQKEKIIECTFEILKQPLNYVEKEKFKIYLLSNPEFCDKFYITKNQIMRDLAVYSTACEGVLSYEQMYEFIKSIQITNKGLKPSIGYKIKEKPEVKSNKQIKSQKASSLEDSEMQKYLKTVFTYFDTKYEKIIERQKYEIAMKKALLFDSKKYKYLKKEKIVEFGQELEKIKKKVNKKDYYKTLDIKYLGLEQIMNLYKKFQVQPQQQEQKVQEVSQTIEQKKEEDPFSESFPQPQTIKETYQIPSSKLEDKDFQKYGWGQQQTQKEQFSNLKDIDKYYRQMQNRNGNQIHWNGFDHYQQDFTKFNQLIKKMNQEHKQDKDK